MTGLGAAIALALNIWVIIPALGPGNVARLAALGGRIDSGPGPTVVFVGNSITVEGIDASVVAEAIGPGATVENWGINGCALEEVRVILPKVLRAKPRYVVVSLLPNDLGPAQDVNLEKAYGYGVGGFGGAWPRADRATMFPGISEATERAMKSSRFQQGIFFRSTLLDWVNREARLVFRSGLRRARDDDWSSPWEMTSGISGTRLERHVDDVMAIIDMRTGNGWESGEELIRSVARQIVEGGATAVFTIAPQHPQMRARTEAILAREREIGAELGAMPGVVFLDASTLLGADGFADAVHPNALGREAYSRAVGQAIAEAERSGEGR